jgi:hypothetical protein
MPRPYPHGRRRRRPGRRPPHRYSGPGDSARPQGFTPPVFRTFYDLFLPGLRGAEKKRLFNQASGWIVLPCALLVAALGYSELGVLGLLLGLGAGLAAGCSIAERGRFYRR